MNVSRAYEMMLNVKLGHCVEQAPCEERSIYCAPIRFGVKSKTAHKRKAEKKARKINRRNAQ